MKHDIQSLNNEILSHNYDMGCNKIWHNENLYHNEIIIFIKALYLIIMTLYAIIITT